MPKGRKQVIEMSRAFEANGRFEADLAKRVAVPTESQKPERHADLQRYVDDIMAPSFSSMGFSTTTFENPIPEGGPVLVAKRWEGDDLPTAFGYGHGDVVNGMEDQWADGRSPWVLSSDGDRIYGRGTADNKGQHTLNMLALEAVLAVRGRLGFNMIYLIETSEEVGSHGLREICARERDSLSADVFIASDGPRVAPDTPTFSLGERGSMNFALEVSLRTRAHHSGGWGGILADPSVILAHAIASLMTVDGRILVPEWIPKKIQPTVRAALDDCPIDVGKGEDKPDPDWGETDLTLAEKLFAWTSFDVLALGSGNPDSPVCAIPPTAVAHCGLRFVTDVDEDDLLGAVRRHLDRRGLSMVEVVPSTDLLTYAATRLDPTNPWVEWARDSVAETLGCPPQILPSGSGSLPNDIFSELLGLPTIWVPHSYNSCCQHAPNEHLLRPLVRDGLGMMAGLYWDLGTPDTTPYSDTFQS